MIVGVNSFVRILVQLLSIAIAVWLAAATSGGISYGGDAGVLIAVALLLAVMNAILKPLLVLFALPFIILTMGLGLWILNALLFLMVGGLIGGFEVAGFGSALWGALWVSIANLLSQGKRTSNGAREQSNVNVRWNVQERGRNNANRSGPQPGGELYGDSQREKSHGKQSGKDKSSPNKDDVIDI